MKQRAPPSTLKSPIPKIKLGTITSGPRAKGARHVKSPPNYPTNTGKIVSSSLLPNPSDWPLSDVAGSVRAKSPRRATPTPSSRACLWGCGCSILPVLGLLGAGSGAVLKRLDRRGKRQTSDCPEPAARSIYLGAVT